ncbi:glycoside hydrolase family 1 protein [Vibrio hippocampi]|nr:family 1 glycosylhydrolase [Vibrio hippocampi]
MFKFNKYIAGIAITAIASISLTACNGSENSGARDNNVDISTDAEFLEFPNGFLWGSATSAYQVEGAWDVGGRGYTNWDLYTQQLNMANGETGNVAIDQYHRYKDDIKLMAEAGLKSYRFSIAWSRIYPTGMPFVTDELGQPVLDSSGNLQPIPPNAEGVAHYSDLIDELIKNDIEPVVTLFHWDIPVGLWAAGSFNNRFVVDMFAAYSEAVFRNYGDRVSKWITMNEPFVNATMIEGIMAVMMEEMAAGGETSLDAMMAMMKDLPLQRLYGLQMSYIHHYLLAHARAVEIQRNLEASGDIIEGDIGISFDLGVAKPVSDSDADKQATALYNALKNDWFVFPITRGYYPAEPLARLRADGYDFNFSEQVLADDLAYIVEQGLDFTGVNYYTRVAVSADVTDGDFGGNASPMNGNLWDAAYVHYVTEYPNSENGIYDPQGFYETLMYIDNEIGGKPVLITENGGGYRVEDKLTNDGKVHDTLRTRFIKGHIKATWQAINDGANVIGYTAWSLFDNFEWFNGYNGRFGMIYIDYENDLKRYPKDSYYWYADTIEKNGVDND